MWFCGGKKRKILLVVNSFLKDSSLVKKFDSDQKDELSVERGSEIASVLKQLYIKLYIHILAANSANPKLTHIAVSFTRYCYLHK